MTDGDRISELEALLREEREFRQAAESRVQALTDKAELWRIRAEERSARIERLMAELELPAIRKLAGRIRRSVRTGGLPNPQTGTLAGRAGPRYVPVYPAVKIAAAVASEGLAACLATADVVDLGRDPNPYADADIVIVEPAAFRTLSDGARARLAEWAALEGRQPMVVWASGDAVGHDLAAVMRGDELIAATRTHNLDTVSRHGKGRVHHLAECFDPALHTPAHRSAEVSNVEVGSGAGLRITGEARAPTAVFATPEAIGDPPGWLVRLAALGVPVVDAAKDDAGRSVPEWSGAAATRWAYRHHAPWVRLAELLRLAGVEAPDPTPAVGVLLVSRRPEEVPQAIARIAVQTHQPVELVVGLHGGGRSAAIDEAIAASGLTATVLEFGAELSLGQCLNQAAEATSAPLLAKLDDDDHYGPAYLEDGIHAVRHSGADVVVKAAQYTYLAARDETVLRRSRQEHAFLDGSTAGATFILHRSTWDAVKFPHRTRGEDLRFLRGVRTIGGSVYAGSRWEFCYVRRAGHTWTAADETFLAGAVPAWEGFRPERVEVPNLIALR